MEIAPINHIEIVDEQPMIRGRRVKVRMIASMYVRAGAPIDEIMEQYNISAAEAHAALAYYYDHKDAIEAYWEEREQLLHEIGTPLEEHIEQLKARQSKNESRK
jgi:uncharacterized protein (DUF433 family)